MGGGSSLLSLPIDLLPDGVSLCSALRANPPCYARACPSKMVFQPVLFDMERASFHDLPARVINVVRRVEAQCPPVCLRRSVTGVVSLSW